MKNGKYKEKGYLVINELDSKDTMDTKMLMEEKLERIVAKETGYKETANELAASSLKRSVSLSKT